MKTFSKGSGILVAVITSFILFIGLVASTDLYLSKLTVDLLYSWGLITVWGHSIFGFILFLLLILPSYFFWLGVIVVSYSFACEKFNIPLKYSIL